MEDIELAQLCARGDEDARKELYMRYAAYLYALCIRYSNDRETAKDLMHDAMIKIYETIGKYRSGGSLKAWCARVTVNMAIDRIRKSGKINFINIEAAYDVAEEPAGDDLAKIPGKELMRMVNDLPDAKRIIFNLFCVDGFSHKEIAKMLNIKEKTSSSLLFKARKQLAGEIREYIKRNGL
ncbi:MAG: RNA polymerase sigma factor [Candidatus Cryptobacteroides sp.]